MKNIMVNKKVQRKKNKIFLFALKHEPGCENCLIAATGKKSFVCPKHEISSR